MYFQFFAMLNTINLNHFNGAPDSKSHLYQFQLMLTVQLKEFKNMTCRHDNNQNILVKSSIESAAFHQAMLMTQTDSL